MLACLGLVACQAQPSAISLDQAKQITTQLSGQGLVAPPRTITDITLILEQEKPDPARAARARAAAEAQPAPGLAGNALAQFYFDRASAAEAIGRVQQRVEDLRQAVKLGDESEGDAESDFDLARALQMLSIAESRIGHFKEAAAMRQREAETLSRRQLGRLVGAYADLAVSSARAGDFAAAERWVGEAEGAYQKLHKNRNFALLNENWRTAILRAQGEIAEQHGRNAEAEARYREALVTNDAAVAKLPRFPDPPPPGTLETRGDIIRLGLARILLAEGRTIEAELEARQALTSALKRRGRDAPETAIAVVALSDVVREQGRSADAERLASAAVAIYQDLGSGPGSTVLAGARERVAQAQISQRHWDEALATFDTAKRELAAGGDASAGTLESNLGYAAALVHGHRAGEAVAIAERATARRTQRYGAEHYATAEARGYLAASLAAAGQRDRALAEFRVAIPILVAGVTTGDDGGAALAREGRRRFIIEAYLGLLAGERAGGDARAAEAFRLAELIRGRGVQEAIAAAAARGAAREPELADLVRREQDAKAQRAALFATLSDLVAAPSDQRDETTIRELRTAIDQLGTARAALRQEIGKRFPDYAALVDPPPATIETARRALQPGEALIATYAASDALFVWAVPNEGSIAFAASPIAYPKLSRMVGALRRALNPSVTQLGDIPAFDVATAHELYAATLQKVAPGWQGAKSLVVVAHGPLAQLPFSLLVTEAVAQPPEADKAPLFAGYRDIPYLIRRTAVTQLPSTAALAALRALPSGNAARRSFAGFGDPWFTAQQAAEGRSTPGTQLAAAEVATRGLHLRAAATRAGVASADLAQLPRLPDTAQEVREVAAALDADPKRDIFLGAAASEAQVRGMKLDDRKVVMFATHGLVPGDLDGLTQPALALTPPAIAGAGAGDGLLTMEKILALKLDADWVVLSACNTAAGDGAGAEAVSGLGRAFFYAGARAVLVTNWPVETRSARRLTTETFRRQAATPGLSRGEALRQAELALIDGPGALGEDGAALYSYAHPIFWAPFSLVGDGG